MKFATLGTRQSSSSLKVVVDLNAQPSQPGAAAVAVVAGVEANAKPFAN